MRPTYDYISAKFDDFNRQCFDGTLPRPAITLVRARTFLGKIQFKILRGPFGRIRGYSDYVLKISTLFDLPEALVEDTLLHEMIHYKIALSGKSDTSTHGKRFRAEMERLNRDFGRHITISSHLTQEQRDSDTRKKPHYLIVSTLPEGTEGITVVAPSHIVDIHRSLSRHYRIRWYYSTDPWFNRFPLSRSTKIYIPEPEELRKHLEDAVPMKWDGKTLKEDPGA